MPPPTPPATTVTVTVTVALLVMQIDGASENASAEGLLALSEHIVANNTNTDTGN